MKFASLKELIVHLVLIGSLGAAALGSSLATNDAFPAPASVVVANPAPHDAPHDHAHDHHGHAVEGQEVTIDLNYGARATDASGEVAVSRRGIHAHAVRGEDGYWEIESLDQVRYAKNELHSTSDPHVWEETALAGELPHDHDGDHDDDDHGDHDHDDHDHDDHDDHVNRGGVTDHLGHALGEGERQVDTAFEARITNAEGSSFVARGGSHQHWALNPAGRRVLESAKNYFKANNEQNPRLDPAPADAHAGHMH